MIDEAEVPELQVVYKVVLTLGDTQNPNSTHLAGVNKHFSHTVTRHFFFGKLITLC